jgi:hypothetical protein
LAEQLICNKRISKMAINKQVGTLMNRVPTFFIPSFDRLIAEAHIKNKLITSRTVDLLG